MSGGLLVRSQTPLAISWGASRADGMVVVILRCSAGYQTPCEKGFFNNETNQDSQSGCTPCPMRATTAHAASTNISACFCTQVIILEGSKRMGLTVYARVSVLPPREKLGMWRVKLETRS